jgi:hypothetical protein
MTTDDVHDAPRPLPLRLEPQPRETLPGYLKRVAVTFSASPAAVVAPISARWATRIRAGRCARSSGIAMTDRTVASTARRLNLTPDEVRAMLASTDEDITIGFDRVPAATFDPATGTATLADQATLGWLVDARFDRFCRACDRQTPDITRLEWRYPWYTICPIHLCLLRPHNPDENADTDFDELLEVQEQLMAIITGQDSFARLSRRDGFIELNAAVEVLSRVRGGLRLKMTGLVEPWFIARILPDAFTAIETPMDTWPDTVLDLAGGKHPGGALSWALERHGATSPFGLRADLLRYAGQHGQYLGLWAKDIRIPAFRRESAGTHYLPAAPAARARRARIERLHTLAIHPTGATRRGPGGPHDRHRRRHENGGRAPRQPRPESDGPASYLVEPRESGAPGGLLRRRRRDSPTTPGEHRRARRRLAHQRATRLVI